MANHLISVLVALNLFSILSTNGRVVQKKDSSAVYISDIKGKPVSLQVVGRTNADDVQGLVALVTRFPTLEENNLDPCISPRWTWIECNSDARPRIVALILSKRSLIGSLPVFSSMTALQRIDLSQNYFSGNIPSFLGTFSNLQDLNVADNLYDGYIPDSIACNKNLTLRVARNAGLYVSSQCISTGNIVDTTLPTTTYTYYPPTRYTYPTPDTSDKSYDVRVILSCIGLSLLLISIVGGTCAACHHKDEQDAAIAAAVVANAGTRPDDQNTNIPGNEMPTNSIPTNTNPVVPK